jgi:hypothetical protein
VDFHDVGGFLSEPLLLLDPDLAGRLPVRVLPVDLDAFGFLSEALMLSSSSCSDLHLANSGCRKASTKEQVELN